MVADSGEKRFSGAALKIFIFKYLTSVWLKSAFAFHLQFTSGSSPWVKSLDQAFGLTALTLTTKF